MNLEISEQWLKENADKEANQPISVGGLVSRTVASLAWGHPSGPGMYVMDYLDWKRGTCLVTIKDGEDCEGGGYRTVTDNDGPVGLVEDLINEGVEFFGPIPDRGER